MIITPGNLADLTDQDSTQIDGAMMQMNELLVSDTASIHQYQKMFALLQDSPAFTPLLYHCTAGKDRTGMATALILFVLGVIRTGLRINLITGSKSTKEVCIVIKWE